MVDLVQLFDGSMKNTVLCRYKKAKQHFRLPRYTEYLNRKHKAKSKQILKKKSTKVISSQIETNKTKKISLLKRLSSKVALLLQVKVSSTV